MKFKLVTTLVAIGTMNKQICLPIIFGISTLLSIPSANAYLSTATTVNKSYLAESSGSTSNHPAYTGILREVDKIAQQITVQIVTSKPETGYSSGVIIAKHGQTYYVLTASHVMEKPDNYQIVTPDGRQYPVSSSEVKTWKDRDVDLALVPFTSSQTYQVATIANYDFRDVRTPVFVSGFTRLNAYPATPSQRMLTFGWVWRKDYADFETRDKYSFSEGQELLYTNLSYPGMGGGAVLDTKGRVVGINTAAEAELMNNQQGHPVELNVGYSLGVPISNFLSLISQDKILQQGLGKVEKVPPTDLNKAESVSIKNQLLSLTASSNDADALAWLNYGNAMWRAGNYDSALDAFERAIQIIQQLPDYNKHLYALAYYGKSLTLFDSRNYSSAVEAFEQATQINAHFPQAWRWIGVTLNHLKKYPEALTAYQQAIKFEPKDFVLTEELGLTLYHLKRYQEAVAAYSDAIELKKHSLAYTNRGVAYDKLKQYQKALDDYNHAIAITPDYVDAYYNRGLVYDELKQYQKAINDYNKVLTINPDYADVYNHRGNVYYELKEYQKALDDFTRSLATDSPDDANPYLGRGKIYYDLKEYQKALDDFTYAIAITPDFAEAYLERGNVYYELKEYQKALADWQKAAQLFQQQQDMQQYQSVQELIKLLPNNP